MSHRPSESALQPHHLSPGVAHLAFLVCPMCFWHPVPRGLGGGSRCALGIAGSGAFQMGSFLSPTTAFGGLPRVVDAVFQSVHSMSVTASVAQLLSSVSLLTVRVRKAPALLPTMCSSVCESLPNQQPYTNCVWLFCKCAPGRLAKTNSPNGNTG